MIRHTLSALAGALVIVAGASPVFAQAGEDNMARCQQLHGLWAKHNGTSAYSKMLDADMGLEQCRKGNYTAGVAQLKSVLQRQQIPVPAAPSVAAQ
ncbi:MAG: hypothetical protein EPO10_27255 [Reyranella sp.]|uniref:hypothetical protein n=1 Tax=Reyranella sp. TaxID=1929291 RepID=UPI001208D40C|nr:hypothetical protein [Reyranella sp.]TAJ96411.1 MAG: hypothetical protein EPO41_06725 [Reyranella sp.]TBR23214.1 MAG: hypothetical protein EPO10_27255 [Reyranella sp.]